MVVKFKVALNIYPYTSFFPCFAPLRFKTIPSLPESSKLSNLGVGRAVAPATLRGGGKSGLRRARCQVTPGGARAYGKCHRKYTA